MGVRLNCTRGGGWVAVEGTTRVSAAVLTFVSLAVPFSLSLFFFVSVFVLLFLYVLEG